MEVCSLWCSYHSNLKQLADLEFHPAAVGTGLSYHTQTQVPEHNRSVLVMFTIQGKDGRDVSVGCQ